MDIQFEHNSNGKSMADDSEKKALVPETGDDSHSKGLQPKSDQLSESSLQLCMSLGCGTVYAARTVIPLVVPDVAAELGWSNVLVGYVLSFFFWGYAMTQVLGGHLADRLGGARVIIFTQLVGAASLLLFPAVVVVWPAAAVILRCLLGLVQGPHYPSVSSVTNQLVPSARRARFLSVCFIGSPLGTILIGLVGSALLQNLGWRAVVSLTGLLYAGCACWLYGLTKDCPRPARRPGGSGGGGGVPWAALLRSRPVWACILIHMSHTTTWFILISWLPSYFKRTHPEAKAWLVNTLPFVFNAIGTLLSVRIAEWLQRRQLSLTAVRRLVEVGSQLTAGIALFTLPMVSSAVTSVVLISIASFMTSQHAAGGLLLPQDMCPDYVGSMFGVMNTGGAIAGFVSNLAAGFLVERYGDFSAVFQMAASLSVAGAAMFGTMGSAERLQL